MVAFFPVDNQMQITVHYRLVNEEVVNKIAVKVHNAWMAEKQRQGFADHPLHFIAVRPMIGERISGIPPVDKETAIEWNRAPLALYFYQQGCCEKEPEKHHPDMVPYDQLDEPTKEYDRATARAVLDALLTEEGDA